jgi:large subunit ribosomal protein L4
MAQATAYSKTGAKQEKKVTLPTAVFGVEADHNLVGQAYRTYLANGRSAGASVLNRGDVRGGGKKPWRQKGTGRARVGSSRVPNWRGGGSVFGPTGLENYKLNLPTKMKRLAIRQALSLQTKDDKVTVIETFDCPEGKVKPTLKLLGSMKLSGRILLVVSEKDQLVDRATRNIAGLTAVDAMYLNVFEIMNADHIVISQKALKIIEDWLTSVRVTKAKVEVAK